MKPLLLTLALLTTGCVQGVLLTHPDGRTAKCVPDQPTILVGPLDPFGAILAAAEAGLIDAAYQRCIAHYEAQGYRQPPPPVIPDRPEEPTAVKRSSAR